MNNGEHISNTRIVRIELNGQVAWFVVDDANKAIRFPCRVTNSAKKVRTRTKVRYKAKLEKEQSSN